MGKTQEDLEAEEGEHQARETECISRGTDGMREELGRHRLKSPCGGEDGPFIL